MDLNLKYELSELAVTDLEDIYRYTRENFGRRQAKAYLEELEVLFSQLRDHTKLGRSRKEIRKELRSIAMRNHVVFYRSISKGVRIIRVIHASRDLDQFFPTQL